MSDLKQLYRQAIVARVAELQSALRHAENGVDTADEALRRIAHSLRGSGATYGFPEVTDAAGAVEDASTDEIQHQTKLLIDVLSRVIDGGPKADRILLVDDDPEILLLLRTVLSVGNRDLITAENGKDAISLLAGHPYKLIILDLLLPDMDGRDVLKHIRSDGRYANTPVIVLSAKTTSDTRRECESLGSTAFFEKPFDPEAVAAAVGAQLLRASSSEQPPSA